MPNGVWPNEFQVNPAYKPLIGKLDRRFVYAVIDWNIGKDGKTTRVEVRDAYSGRFIVGVNHLKTSREAWNFATAFTGSVVDLRYK